MTDKPIIHIVTRAYNRLEFTVQCVAAVARNTVWNEYRHWIITQGSTDGTTEWLKWIKGHCPYYEHVAPVYCDKNYGDWGGMQLCDQEYSIQPDDYVVQLDNDVLVPPFWLSALMALRDAKDLSVVMLRLSQGGMTDCEPPNKYEEIETPMGIMGGGQIKMPVACYLTRGDLFLEHAKSRSNCRAFGQTFRDKTWKLWAWQQPWLNPYQCTEIDNSHDFRMGRGTCLSEQKYSRNTCWEKL